MLADSMTASPAGVSAPTVICKLVVMRAGKTQVLLMEDGAASRLPTFEIPKWERPAPHLTRWMKQNWGAQTVCLFQASPEESVHCSFETPCYVLEVVDSDWTPRAGMHWYPRVEVGPENLPQAMEYWLLESAVSQALAHDTVGAGSFASSGFLEPLRTWVESVLKQQGWTLEREWCQYNLGPFFCLIRFETSGPDVWFKAVGKPNHREYAISLKLAELYPGYVPKILGRYPEWNGWLMCHESGEHPSADWDLRSWEVVAESLAALQLESTGDCETLLDSTCTDLRLGRLQALRDDFFAVIADLMTLQTVSLPPPLTDLELDFTKSQVNRSLALLEEIDIPDALVHLDLNSGNILLCSRRVVFLDWVQAGVGLPLLNIEYLMALLKRIRPDKPDWASSILQAYSQAWETRISLHRLAHALHFTPIVAAMAFAVGCLDWSKDPRNIPLHTGKLLRSIARGMHQEANRLECDEFPPDGKFSSAGRGHLDLESNSQERR